MEEVVQTDQKVKVKVLCEKTPGKMSLTIKDVDQETGEDLYPDDPAADPSQQHTPSGKDAFLPLPSLFCLRILWHQGRFFCARYIR